MVGIKFGRLTVVCEQTGGRCFCRCECGTEKSILRCHILSGRTQSCGCLHAEVIKLTHRTHGQCGSPEWRTWRSIKQRCLNPKQEAYAKYGAKGITVCQEWIESFEAFFSHVGPKPSPKHSIDRIDNARGYEPGNVRWATASEQGRNKTTNVLVELDGQSMSIDAACHAVGISKQAYYERKARGVDPLGPRLSKAARRPRAITGGMSDGTVTSASASVGMILSDYLTTARQAERANHDAARREAGTYVSGQDALQRTLARADAHWDRCASVHATHQAIMRTSVEVKRQLGELVRAMLRETDYGHSTRGELAEVAVHLGRLDAALRDLTRVQAERNRAAVMAERAAATLASELTEFIERRPSHAV